MRLVYPVYLDAPMMTAFLASLEGGVADEASVSHASADAEERGSNASVRARLGGLLSGIMDAEGGGQLSRQVTERLESQYKVTVRFPEASLFIRLRDVLLEKRIANIISSAEELDGVGVGDLVEFQGLATANPAFQIRQAFEQILPVLEPIQSAKVFQLEAASAQLQNAKPGKPVQIDGEERIFQNAADVRGAREMVLALIQAAKAEATGYETMGRIMSSVFPEESTRAFVMNSEGFRVVCRILPTFARDERIQDIFDAQWHCLGKVISILRTGDEYDLLKGSPISYLAKEQLTEVFSAFKSGAVSMNIADPVVRGPALVIAPLAIFA